MDWCFLWLVVWFLIGKSIDKRVHVPYDTLFLQTRANKIINIDEVMAIDYTDFTIR